MAVDYDLVILGGTPEGYAAAAQAARYGARVALILQDLTGERSSLIQRGILHLTQPDRHNGPPAGVPSWQWLRQRATLIADTLTHTEIPQLLVQGVDVIAERGQIEGDRPLTLKTPSRTLTSRAVLVATGNRYPAPPLPGLADVVYDTPETFWQREQLPESVVVVGSSPAGLVLAQWLRHWQIPVTLVTSQAQLLAQADPDVSRWLTAQLRAEGVDLRLGARVTEVATPTATQTGPEGAIAVQLTDDCLKAAALVVAGRPVPHLEQLGLERCLPRDRPLRVNAFLQTAHPRIYACGAAIGGDELPAIARQEAHRAVHNALFWPRRRIDYQALPYDLPTQPPLARVGLTEPQAVQRFGREAVLTARQSLYDNPQAQWRDATVGFCKLIAHRDGRWLGCHGVGPEAPEWVQAIALLMQQKTPWWRVTHFAALPYSLMAMLPATAQQWERDRWLPGRWRRDWAENWCNWRRSQ